MKTVTVCPKRVTDPNTKSPRGQRQPMGSTCDRGPEAPCMISTGDCPLFFSLPGCAADALDGTQP